MDINWFPGHMAKSTREIEENLRISDCVVYVLDCRAVRSCFNPNFDAMIRVPIVYALNKADTCPVADTERWVNVLSTGGNLAVAVNGADSSCRKKLLSSIRSACSNVFERQRARGLNLHARAIVVGVPNTGKSTIINTLCGKARLVTGDKAGVTRAAKWTRIDSSLDILDTPGTLYPKITDRTVGENLAIIGSIKDEVIDAAELALALIDRLNAIDGNVLAARYNADITADVSGLESIARSRGFKSRGGEFDIDRAAAAVIDDFRKGRLGKIALESV
ncbi:MAG: ribosome biogenesis GTPase YlqF [Clostridiales bacterium]|nr:ribosome biogenesis GTPase YlqF [Clostridiales bacterium]